MTLIIWSPLDYARTKKALDSCTLCYSDEGLPPRAAVVALGTRAYLALLENEELVPGHCRIVPIQHHFSTLEAEDETWDEIRVLLFSAACETAPADSRSFRS